MKIRKLDRRGKGYTRIEWVLDYYEGPKRIRKFFYSKGDAEAAMDDVKSQHKHAGQTWIDLTPEERNDLMLVVSEARQRKVTVRQVWEAYRNGKLDATPMQRCTLANAIAETIEWRRGENLRDRYLKELEAYLKRFASGRSEVFIDSIGVADIQQWFAGRNEALSTQRANMGRLGSMFDVAWKKGYIKENPCLKLPTIKIRKEAPVIFTPAQTRILLHTAVSGAKQRAGTLPYLVIGTFVGVRPEEMEALKWRDLDLKHATLRIDVAASKVSKRRIVTLHPTALEWLKRCKQGKADEFILPSAETLKRIRKEFRAALKVEWSSKLQDVMRHTAGSYLLALHGNANEVANMLGNSARTLEKDYKQLVNKTDCTAFWALTPNAIRKGAA